MWNTRILGVFACIVSAFAHASPVFHVHSDILHDDGTREHTYLSTAMPLRPGDVVFTNPDTTTLVFPPGPISISEIHADVVTVERSGNVSRLVPTPLDTVYNHHWIIFNGKHNNSQCSDLTYVFGVGAESRGTPVRYPAPYGFFADGTEHWTANIHLLRTQNLDSAAGGVKGCIECVWTAEKQAQNQYCTPEESGNFVCCWDGMQCATEPGARNVAPIDYYLRYTIRWRPTEVARPLSVFVLDASGCHVEYNINRTTAGSDLSVTKLSWRVSSVNTAMLPGTAAAARMASPPTRSAAISASAVWAPHDGILDGQAVSPLPAKSGPLSATTTVAGAPPQAWDVVYAVGHQHIGAYNITLSLNGKAMCVSYPQYGAHPGTVGDEWGYVVAIPPCNFDTPVRISVGDVLTVTSLYNVGEHDPRTWNAGGWHDCVMSLFYLAAAPVA
eukprot:TRINITY_DN4511_c0_g1_i1.p1 TRINITY_DN4511_c0_g1~~TRINITY_DN4511_c0_g1_i1.p1  ORF type:complete len:443 (+),score=84.45 TRINITY_DN4511_c0_g1_i1:104-1432(+)